MDCSVLSWGHGVGPFDYSTGLTRLGRSYGRTFRYVRLASVGSGLSTLLLSICY